MVERNTRAGRHDGTRAIFERFHAAWEAADPARIAALHASDGVFHLRDGSPAVHGRDALERHYAALFAQYGRFGWDIKRLLLGERHWVFEYDMLIAMAEPDGTPFTAAVGMVDIVEIDDAGDVTRKDVLIDQPSRDAAFARARGES